VDFVIVFLQLCGAFQVKWLEPQTPRKRGLWITSSELDDKLPRFNGTELSVRDFIHGEDRKALASKYYTETNTACEHFIANGKWDENLSSDVICSILERIKTARDFCLDLYLWQGPRLNVVVRPPDTKITPYNDVLAFFLIDMHRSGPAEIRTADNTCRVYQYCDLVVNGKNVRFVLLNKFALSVKSVCDHIIKAHHKDNPTQKIVLVHKSASDVCYYGYNPAIKYVKENNITLDWKAEYI